MDEEKSPADKAMDDMLSVASEAKLERTFEKVINDTTKTVRKTFWKAIKAWPEEDRFAFARGMAYYHEYLGSLLAHGLHDIADNQDFDREEYENFLFLCLTADCNALSGLVDKLGKES